MMPPAAALPYGKLAQLVGRFEGRRFQIPTHKSANVERKLEDYLKPRG